MVGLTWLSDICSMTSRARLSEHIATSVGTTAWSPTKAASSCSREPVARRMFDALPRPSEDFIARPLGRSCGRHHLGRENGKNRQNQRFLGIVMNVETVTARPGGIERLARDLPSFSATRLASGMQAVTHNVMTSRANLIRFDCCRCSRACASTTTAQKATPRQGVNPNPNPNCCCTWKAAASSS